MLANTPYLEAEGYGPVKPKISGTPTRKGLYDQCQDCLHRLKNTDKKYPCAFPHSQVRRSGGVRYERDFKICGLKETK